MVWQAGNYYGLAGQATIMVWQAGNYYGLAGQATIMVWQAGNYYGLHKDIPELSRIMSTRRLVPSAVLEAISTSQMASNSSTIRKGVPASRMFVVRG